MEPRPEIDDPLDLDPVLLELVEEAAMRLLEGEALDLDQLIADHPDRADDLRSLLPAMRGLADLADEPAPPSPPADDDPEVFGKFRILREVGRGGMGIVYEAEQEGLKRRVALKILPRTAAMDPRALQRFQLEAQVAGWLQHPRIVPVHDVGIVGGVPYYAMQFIEGGSLADLVRALRAQVEGAAAPESPEALAAVATGLLTGRLSPSRFDPDGSRAGPPPPASSEPPSPSANPSLGSRSYLRGVAGLGVQAAEALGHAHDRGVVHRDIKPANLLVDLQGMLWVADFGMADVQGDAGLTLTGDLPGTLRYMSPEQAAGRRALVDRRTDLYSLGATLYELLTLRPAVAGDDRHQIFRAIVEGEPTPLRRLNRSVPADLATIVAKAMARDPANRYETAWHLAEDLGRFLDGRPIAARPVGPVARSWRWCKRKPVQAGLVAALGLALVVGFAGITWNWREAVHQRGLLAVAERGARAQAAKADAVNRFLIEGLIQQAEPANNPAAAPVTLTEVLGRAAERVGTSFPGQPEIEAAIRIAIGRAYHGLGDYPRGEEHFRAALRLLQAPGVRDEAGRLEAASELGHIRSHLGHADEALALLEQTAPEARRVLGPSHRVALQAALHLAEVQRGQGRLDEAEALYRRCLDDAGRAPEPDPEIHFTARFHLGSVFLAQDRAAEAEALYRELAKEQRLHRGPEHPHTLTTLNNLGAVLERRKRYDEAERIFRDCLAVGRRVLGASHPDTVTALYNLGHVLNSRGRPEAAEPFLRQSVEARRRAFGPDHPDTLFATSNLAGLLASLGRQAEAEALLVPCLEAQRRVLGPDHRDTRQSAQVLRLLREDPARLIPPPGATAVR